MANQRLKVCLTIFSSPWSELAGGGQLSVHEYACALQDLGHDVHVLYSRARQDQRAGELPYEAHFTQRLDLSVLNLDCLSFWVALSRLAQRERFDIIHGNAEEALAARRVAEATGARFVATCHASFLPQRPFASEFRANAVTTLRRTDYFMLRATLRRASRVITYSKFSRERVLATFGPTWQDRVSVIRPGVDESWFQVDRAPGRGFRVVTWTRLVPGKGLEELILASALLRREIPDFSVTIFGSGPLLGKCQLLVQSLELQGVVKLAGRQDASTIQQVTRNAHVAVFPSHIESFGQSIAQALTAGIPVIATRAGAIPELVEDGETGLLVEPRDVGSLCRAIRALHHNPESAESMACRAHTRWRPELRWRSTAQHAVRRYRELLADSRETTQSGNR